MKKRTIAIVATALALLLVVPGVAFARGYYHQKIGAPAACKQASVYACTYLKETKQSLFSAKNGAANNNGLNSTGKGQGYIDADGNGVCDNATGTYCAQGYVDADADGVCDNCGAATYGGQGQGQGYIDADNDGICDNATGTYCGRGYVDADGDGICDNCGSASYGGGGRGYVDTDGNGICDNYGSGAHHGNGNGGGNGSGQGYGRHHR